ncbi:hypothetical protein [Candidatus Rhodobacter oscarellae]|nr:hypothetical protein [Candidatus Rhodobacter lobularis]
MPDIRRPLTNVHNWAVERKRRRHRGGSAIVFQATWPGLSAEIVQHDVLAVHEAVCQEASNLDAEIQAFAEFSPLKAWAMRLVQRKGLKKAMAATSRKLAVILKRQWRDGTEFGWTTESLPA